MMDVRFSPYPLREPSMKQKLTLKTERLAELTTDDLHRVAGAGPDQEATLGKLCVSVVAACCSYQMCTTAISCSCAPTWNCA